MKHGRDCHSVWLCAVIWGLSFSGLATGQECNGTATYVKRNFFRPRGLEFSLLMNGTEPGITEPCLLSCANESLASCPVVLMDYDASSCFQVTTSSPYDDRTLFQLGAVPSGNVNFFQKTCLDVPSSCSARLWALEVTPGYELVGSARKVVDSVTDPLACGQLCLNETDFDCLSAGFYADDTGNGTGNGSCVLSVDDRRTMPDAYRASLSDVVYVENQCPPVSNACPMNEFQNGSLASFTDRTLENATLIECERECLNASSFVCRGFSFAPDANTSRCRLHADDSYSLGPGAVRSVALAIYRERVVCLDLTVACSSSALLVTLHTRRPFVGRVFAVGFAESCNADGAGANVTTLALALDAGFPAQQCGVAVQRPAGASDRFESVTALVQVQYNAIIQRRGDRVARVSCRQGDAPPPSLELVKVVTFAVDGSLGVVNISVNATTVLPNVRLRIVDLLSGADEDANQTVVGKPLQIRIENVRPDGAYDLAPSNLTAGNADGSQTFALLDSRGCPTDAATFPGFARDADGTYAADFAAFRFPESLLVRFRLNVHLCDGPCLPVDCSGGALRNRRARLDAADDDSDAVPLEVDLTVLPSPPRDPPVILARSVDDAAVNVVTVVTVPPASNRNAAADSFCVPNDTALGVLIGWIVLQVLILLACAFLVRHQLDRQDKQLRQSLENDLLDFDNNRFRGHWSQNVNVLPPQDGAVPGTSRRHGLGTAGDKMESPY